MYSTYDKACEKKGHNYCLYTVFVNMLGDNIHRCMFCGVSHNPKKPVKSASFSEIISELHSAKVEGREPVFKNSKLKLKF